MSLYPIGRLRLPLVCFITTFDCLPFTNDFNIPFKRASNSYFLYSEENLFISRYSLVKSLKMFGSRSTLVSFADSNSFETNVDPTWLI